MKRDDSDEEKGQLIESDKEEPLIKKNEMLNQDFMYFCALNTPFISTDMYTAPLSKVNDGENDIVYLTF